jgi:hypothetical protein
LHGQTGVIGWSKVVDSLELSRNQASTQDELSQQLAWGEKVKHDEYPVFASVCLEVKSVLVNLFLERVRSQLYTPWLL